MRAAEVAGRAGKQPDGSAKTREAKLVTIWTAESREAEGKPMRDPGSVTYSAAIESAATADTSPDRSDFAERVLRESTRRGFTEACRCVVRGDGSTWIWNTTRELFPQAIPILDRYHAKEALPAPQDRSSARPAKANHGHRSAARHWMTANCRRLCTNSAPIKTLPPRQSNARCTSSAIAPACVTQSFMRKVCVPPLACSRPAAKWS